MTGEELGCGMDNYLKLVEKLKKIVREKYPFPPKRVGDRFIITPQVIVSEKELSAYLRSGYVFVHQLKDLGGVIVEKSICLDEIIATAIENLSPELEKQFIMLLDQALAVKPIIR
ncbi:MAG: hypothetical protein FWH37_03900 [Candidatus Bathyarchaeota archaeon]|nr:hypothetical protein [Candidatus Termiticorpusculum sp.]